MSRLGYTSGNISCTRFICTDNFGDGAEYYFAEDTKELLAYFKKAKHRDVVIDLTELGEKRVMEELYASIS
jgi:hypothetical protein